MSQFVKKAGERDLGTHREIIKRQDANARKEERKPREVPEHADRHARGPLGYGDLLPYVWLLPDI